MMALGVFSRTSGGVASLQQFYGKTQQQRLSNSDMLPHSGIPSALSQPVVARMGPGGSRTSMSGRNPPSSAAGPIDDGWAAPTLDAVAATCAFATGVCEAQRLPQGVALGKLCTSGITVYQLGRDAWNVKAEGGADAWLSLAFDAAPHVFRDPWKGLAQGIGFIWDIINAAGDK